jgi:hypothetical protein
MTAIAHGIVMPPKNSPYEVSETIAVPEVFQCEESYTESLEKSKIGC